MGQVLLPPGGACLSGPCNSGQAPPRATMCSLPPLCYRNSQIIPSAPPRALWLWDFNTSCLRASASRPQKLCPAPCKDAEPAPHYPLALGGVLAVVSPTSRTLLGPRERKQQSILQHQLLGRYNSGLRWRTMQMAQVTASLWQNKKVCFGHCSFPQLKSNGPQSRIKRPSLSNERNHRDFNTAVLFPRGSNLIGPSSDSLFPVPSWLLPPALCTLAPELSGTLTLSDGHWHVLSRSPFQGRPVAPAVGRAAGRQTAFCWQQLSGRGLSKSRMHPSQGGLHPTMIDQSKGIKSALFGPKWDH